MPARRRRAGRHDSRPGLPRRTRSGRAARSGATTRRSSGATPRARRPRRRRSREYHRRARSSAPRRAARPHLRLPARRARTGPRRAHGAGPRAGYILFLGTLEPRKNVGGAARRLRARSLARRPDAPPLVLAGGRVPGADALARRDRARRRSPAASTYARLRRRRASAGRSIAGARLLVLPSFDEGFGMPVARSDDARRAGRRGRPRRRCRKCAGDAGLLVDPDDVAGARRRRWSACCSTTRPAPATGARTGVARRRGSSRWARAADLTCATPTSGPSRRAAARVGG